jgi:hypothetical protein
MMIEINKRIKLEEKNPKTFNQKKKNRRYN